MDIRNSSHYDDKAKSILRSETVDMSRLGADSTWKHPAVEFKNILAPENKAYPDSMTLYHLPGPNYFQSIKNYLVAQALLDNISLTEEGLTIRWAQPFDFAIDDEMTKVFSDWWVPGRGGTFHIDIRKNEEKSHELYRRQNIWHRYKYPGDQSCLVIWGFGRGFNSTGLVISAYIKRANIKIVEIVGLSQLEKGKVCCLEVPVMFKRGDQMEIDVTLGGDYEGKRDEIVVYGFICERIGDRQIG